MIVRPAPTFAMIRSRSGSFAPKRSIAQEIAEAVQSRRQTALDRRACEQPTSTPMTEPSTIDYAPTAWLAGSSATSFRRRASSAAKCFCNSSGSGLSGSGRSIR